MVLKQENLFNSFEKPIPPVRYDVQQIPIEQNGDSMLYFYDALDYASDNFTLPTDSVSVLSLLDGNRSINDLIKFSSGEVSKNDLLNYVRFLDEHGILDSSYFKKLSKHVEQDYEQSRFHLSNTAGVSYPANPNEVIYYLRHAFETHPHSESVSAKALYAPHIDPRVGLSSYVKAFSAIRNLTPQRVFILGTSHYSGMYGKRYEHFPFIASEKTLQLSNGSVESDLTFRARKLPHRWKNLGVTFQDRAHRVEHSIELPLLFLNHIWNHDFQVIPILIGGFDELLYSNVSFREQQVDAFAEFLRANYQVDPDTFFLISGDLSHFGKKFGDEQPATELFSDVHANDLRFLEAASTGNPDHLLYMMKENYDKYRICGFSPLLTFLKAFPGLSGTVLDHQVWDESERESAVTFGSLLFQ